MTDDERKVAEIEARVRPSICDTYGSKGATVEGRILKEDFDYLLTSRLAWRSTSKMYSSLANLTANEENAALQKALEEMTAELIAAQDELDRLRAQSLN